MTGVNYSDFVQAVKENGILNITFTTVIEPDIPNSCPNVETYTVRKLIFIFLMYYKLRNPVSFCVF